MYHEHRNFKDKVYLKARPASSKEACKRLLESASPYHRKARLREVLSELNNEQIKEVLLPFVAGKTPTYEFVKAKYVVKRSKVSVYELIKGELLFAKQTLDIQIRCSRCLVSLPPQGNKMLHKVKYELKIQIRL